MVRKSCQVRQTFHIVSGLSWNAQTNVVLSETGELQEGEKHQERVCEAAWDKFREGYAVYNEPFKYMKYSLSQVFVIWGINIY